MNELTLDQKKMKALSVESRTKILKLVSRKQQTLSDLANKLKMSKPTIKQHLDILVDANLMKQLPTQNIWKYYVLTEDGKKIVKPTDIRVLFMFGFSSIITLVLGIYLILDFAIMGSGGTFATAKDVTEASAVAAAPVAQSTFSAIGSIGIVFLVFLGISILLLAYWYWKEKR